MNLISKNFLRYLKIFLIWGAACKDSMSLFNNVFWTLTLCNSSRDILSLFHVQDFHEELMKFREQVNSRIQSQITQAEIPLPLPLPLPSHFIVCCSGWDFLIQGPYNSHLSLIMSLKSKSFLHHPLKDHCHLEGLLHLYFEFYLIDNIEVNVF